MGMNSDIVNCEYEVVLFDVVRTVALYIPNMKEI